MFKDCSSCGNSHPTEHYQKHSRICRPCKNKKQRETRAKNGDSATKKYEKTPNGYLMRTYRNMESRVKGIQKLKAHLYEGRCILGREEFYQWSLGCGIFIKLFNNYVESGFDMKLAPSIDRIETDKGYEIGNIRWITHSENSRLGAISRHS